MKTLNLFLAAGAVALTAGAANAATYYATSVEDFSLGSCWKQNEAAASACNPSSSRHDPNAALGAPGDSNPNAGKEDFVSLGFGGSLTVGFGQSFSNPQNVRVYEITYSSDGVNPPSDNHKEAVDVYAVLGGMETKLGTLLNYGTNSVVGNVAFDFIKLVDVTLETFGRAGTTSFDGFDVNSVAVAPVPLPAAGLMLMAGLGGFAALRRRKNDMAA